MKPNQHEKIIDKLLANISDLNCDPTFSGVYILSKELDKIQFLFEDIKDIIKRQSEKE